MLAQSISGSVLLLLTSGAFALDAERPRAADPEDRTPVVDGPEDASASVHHPVALPNAYDRRSHPASDDRIDLVRDARVELDFDVAAFDDVRFGMLSSRQDETAVIEAEASAEANAPAGGGQTDLAAAAQNPIANTISVPFENNLYFHGGEDDGTTYVLNFQPVIPIKLNDDWNLINRPIIPLMYLPGAVAGLPEIGGMPVGFDDTFGLGDINYTAFLSPSNSGKFIWGAGPSITFPTATDDVLGSGRWSAGPSFVGLTIQKPILAGVLLRQLWSFAGDSDRRSVNQTLIQPFLNYNLDDGWYLITAPVITANWLSESSDDRWTVPLGGGVGKLFKLGDQPINMNVQVYYNVERPENASDWQLKFTIQLLFPK